jgi:hypothetical protein
MRLNQHLDKAAEQLAALEEQDFDHLDFQWEGIRFQAAATRVSGGASGIQLKATLGRLYFTVEDKTQRAMALERLFTVNRTIDGTYEIGEKGDIHFKSSTRTDGLLKGTNLISALTVILLESENHLRALQSHLKPLPVV